MVMLMFVGRGVERVEKTLLVGEREGEPVHDLSS